MLHVYDANSHHQPQKSQTHAHTEQLHFFVFKKVNQLSAGFSHNLAHIAAADHPRKCS